MYWASENTSSEQCKTCVSHVKRISVVQAGRRDILEHNEHGYSARQHTRLFQMRGNKGNSAYVFPWNFC